jgi:V/A-type H+/Na+-transporting ATPase subunit F
MPDSRVMIIGDRHSVLGFGALGVKVMTPSPVADEIRRIIGDALKEDVAILFITERMANEIPDVIGELSKRPLPSVVVIPDASGASGLGSKKLDEIIVRAVGSRIGSDRSDH